MQPARIGCCTRCTQYAERALRTPSSVFSLFKPASSTISFCVAFSRELETTRRTQDARLYTDPPPPSPEESEDLYSPWFVRDEDVQNSWRIATKRKDRGLALDRTTFAEIGGIQPPIRHRTRVRGSRITTSPRVSPVIALL